MSLSWETAVRPKLLTVVNSHKIVRARQSTFTTNCLQRLRDFCTTENGGGGGGGGLATTDDPDDYQVSPSEVLLPDFACEVRLLGPLIAEPMQQQQVKTLLVLADCLVLLARTSSQVAAEITRWTDQGLSKAQWQALSSEMTCSRTVCLHHVKLDLVNAGTIAMAGANMQTEFAPTSFNSQTLYELLNAAKQLDLASLFISLPLDATCKPTFLGLQSLSRHVSQASLLSQVPLSSSPCSTKFFKKKFDSLWGYFNFTAPVIENSKMFYGAIANADLESNINVSRKPKSKRQKLWAVLKGSTIYMFKKRCGSCNAEYEVDLDNFNELEVTEDTTLKDSSAVKKDSVMAGAIAMSGGPTKTLVVKFANTRKSVYLTPLDRFDFKRWEEALNAVLRGERRVERTMDCMSQLQARRISGLSNSFHNLSSANNSQQESPTYTRKDGKLGLAISRGSREMMASCTNLDELSGKQSPVACSKYGNAAATLVAAYPTSNNPIITVDFMDDQAPPQSDDHDEEDVRRVDCPLKKLEIWRSSQESIDQLTPEEIAELRRRRISAQIQLESLQAEIKKREMHLTPQQIQTLNIKMSDMYEDIQDMSITISKVDRKGKSPQSSKQKKKSL